MKFANWFENDELPPDAKTIAYTGCVLFKQDQTHLLNECRHLYLEATGTHLPVGWIVRCHHMTVKFKPSQQDLNNQFFGENVELTINQYAIDPYAMAVVAKPTVALPESNAISHITIAHSKEVGAVYSNQLLSIAKASNNLKPINPILLKSKFVAVGFDNSIWPQNLNIPLATS